MNTLKNKFKILLEGYNFTNADEVMSALETNQIGVKIDPSYKQLNGNTKPFTKRRLQNFFNKCENLRIKDTTYGIQILLSKTNNINLEQAVNNDGLYEFLKSYKKPWVKQLPEYQEFMNKKYDSLIWHNLEKAIQDNQSNHGKSSKGSGQLQDVKTLYDDGTWKLMVPSSFEGEKAIAYYIENGTEKPAHWCTRADKKYYDHYAKDAPLYVIRNMKTGKSYQMAFTKDKGWDDEDYLEIHFLDQDDVKGDEISNGDLSAIPDNLLQNIKIPFGPRKGGTMLDYKKEPGEDPKAGEKGWRKLGQGTFGKPIEVSSNITNQAKKVLISSIRQEYAGEIEKEIGNKKVYKIVSKNAAIDPRYKSDPLATFLAKGKKEKNEYGQKAGVRRYYIEGKPEEYLEVSYVYDKKHMAYPDKRVEGNLKNSSDFVKEFLSNAAALDSGGRKVENISFTNTKYSKLSDKHTMESESEYDIDKKKLDNIFETINKKYKEKLKSLGIYKVDFGERSPENIRMKGNGYHGMFGRCVEVYPADASDADEIDYFEIDADEIVYFEIEKGKPFKKENIEAYCRAKRNLETYNTPKVREVIFEIMQEANRLWRRSFHNDIINKRASGEYETNMYEDVNYFPY